MTTASKPEFLHKYVTLQGVHSILDKKALKWTCPIFFNDPFDIQHDFSFSFSAQNLRQHYEKKMMDDALKKTMGLMSRKELDEGLQPLLDKMVVSHEEVLNQFQKGWRAEVLKWRVLCLSESCDNIIMWAHYASCHEGAVIRFKNLNPKEGHFRDFKKVNYTSTLPVLASLEEWTVHLDSGTGKPSASTMFERIIFTKSNSWEHEKEWRGIIEAKNGINPNQNVHELYDLNPQEIDSIYLGYRMNQDNKKQILQKLTGPLSHVVPYETFKDPLSYSLIFKKFS